MQKYFFNHRIKAKYLLPLLLIILLISFPNESIKGAKEGISIIINSLLPSLLPFFVCSKILITMGFAEEIGKLYGPVMRKIFNTPGVGSFAFIMGILSGYPLGAKIAADMYEKGLCTKSEAERLLTFCNNSGPIFVIGVVGITMLGSQSCGVFLYLIHIISSISTGIIFRWYKYKEKIQTGEPRSQKNMGQKVYNLGEIISISVKSSVITMAEISGYIIFFSSVICLLEKIKVIDMIAMIISNLSIEWNTAIGISQGIFEISKGIDTLSKNGVNLEHISLILSFSGISVILQVSGIIKSRLSLKIFIIGKLIHASLAMFYTKVSMYFIQNIVYTKTYSDINIAMIQNARNPWTMSFLFLTASVFIYTTTAVLIAKSRSL